MLPSSNNPALSACSAALTEAPANHSAQTPPSNHSVGKSTIRQTKQKQNPLPLPDRTETVPLAHTVPVLDVRNVSAPQPVSVINTEPEMIAEGVFIGEGRAKSGEKVFLKMESVTATNQAAWERYCVATAQLTKHERSALTYAMRHTRKIVNADGEVQFLNDKYDELVDRLGMSKQAFEAFITLCGKNGFFWAPENKRKIKSVNNTHAGATHLRLDTDSKCYVVYASKTAHFKMPDGGEILTSANPLTLKDYIGLFSDLLICVGVDFPEGGYVHSKGMFRNPYSIIEKTHTGLSMVIRGFTGAVAKKFFADKHTLRCKPLSSMQYMISSSLQPEDYRVENYSHDEALSAAKESLDDGDVFEMPDNSIKISALDRLYRNHVAT